MHDQTLNGQSFPQYTNVMLESRKNFAQLNCLLILSFDFSGGHRTQLKGSYISISLNFRPSELIFDELYLLFFILLY